MFLAKTKKVYGGRLRTYSYIVENYREGKKIKRRIIASLGELSEREIDNLMRGLNSLKSKPSLFGPLSVSHEDVFSYGDIFLIHEIWNKIGIGEIIKRSLEGCKVEFDLISSAFLMVANRCIAPLSKLKVWKWQQKVWLKGLSNIDYHKILRTLSHLESFRDRIEVELFKKQIDLFHQKVDLVFYDITSSYFEGMGPEIAKKGHSSDKRADCNQILLALAITKDGIPIGHEVYAGNKKHSRTVIELVNRLKKRFKIDKCIIVGDRGMVSPENIEEIKNSGYDYIFALRKRRLNEVKEIMERKSSKYHKITEREGDKEVIKLYYLEVKRKGIRYLICHNSVIAEKDKERLKVRKKEKEDKIRMIFKSYKDPGVIIKHIARIPDIDRYFKYKLKGKQVVYEENRESLDYENLIAGKWVLKTEDFTFSGEEIIRAYKNLSEIENAFRTIKSFLDLRPMYHRDEDRIKGHVFICVLAYYIQKVIGKILGDKGLKISGLDAIDKLREVKLIKSKINGRIIFQAVKLRKEQQVILKALDISHIPLTYLS